MFYSDILILKYWWTLCLIHLPFLPADRASKNSRSSGFSGSAVAQAIRALICVTQQCLGQEGWVREGVKATLKSLSKMLVLLFLLRGIKGKKIKKKDKQQSHYKLAWVQSLSYIYAFNSAWESNFKEIQLLHALVLASWEVHLYSSIFLDYLKCFLKAFKSREDQSERSLAAILFFFWLCRQKKNLQEARKLCFKKPGKLRQKIQNGL